MSSSFMIPWSLWDRQTPSCPRTNWSSDDAPSLRTLMSDVIARLRRHDLFQRRQHELSSEEGEGDSFHRFFIESFTVAFASSVFEQALKSPSQLLCRLFRKHTEAGFSDDPSFRKTATSTLLYGTPENFYEPEHRTFFEHVLSRFFEKWPTAMVNKAEEFMAREVQDHRVEAFRNRIWNRIVERISHQFYMTARFGHAYRSDRHFADDLHTTLFYPFKWFWDTFQIDDVFLEFVRKEYTDVCYDTLVRVVGMPLKLKHLSARKISGRDALRLPPLLKKDFDESKDFSFLYRDHLWD